uniref:C-type lectin domain-containing protein n=1 Tax=Stomoxys calcitrans TaxID=35570 RepID=A0A1I8NZ51_STOCA
MLDFKIFLTFIFIGLTVAEPQWHNSSDGKHYLIEGEAKYNWFRAKHECSRRDLQLVEIHTETENQALVQLLRSIFGTSTSLWLGANDLFSPDMDTKRPFYWSSSGKPMTFSYWLQGEPNNERNQEHCVHTFAFEPDFKWNDVSCSNQYGFICEEKNAHVEYRSSLNEKRDAVLKAMKKFADSLQQEDEKLLEVVHHTRSLITKNNQDVEAFLEMLNSSNNKSDASHDSDASDNDKESQTGQENNKNNREEESQFSPETNQMISELNDELERSTEEVYKKLLQQFDEVQRAIEEGLKNDSE